MEERECFSSPVILELKAQYELACYRDAAPSRLQCPFGLAGPAFEVVPRHLVEGMINSVLEVQILCVQCHGCRKKQ